MAEVVLRFDSEKAFEEFTSIIKQAGKDDGKIEGAMDAWYSVLNAIVGHGAELDGIEEIAREKIAGLETLKKKML